jgi:ectoine hydroxylase-related dioxygenase (phytanoyl-CoA dioxygenase family)
MSSDFRLPISDFSGQFSEKGFQFFDAAVSREVCDSLALELSSLFEQEQNQSKRKIGGIRNLLKNAKVASLAFSSELISFLTKLRGLEVFPVRAMFFDKTPESNWSVPWHQDLAIAVAERIETPGFEGWSIKEGIPHVLPPATVLEAMLTVRVHLDPCGADSGSLKVIAGSHRFGKLGPDQISEFVTKEQPIVCEVPKGGMFVMHPLLLHSSTSAKTPSHRRILHIEYSGGNLTNGLRWFERQ